MKRIKTSKIACEIYPNEFDFSKTRVRYFGKALSRYDIACYLDCFKPFLNWKIIYDSFSYSYLRNTLIDYLYEVTI